jgi:hypothetical protein
MDDRERLKIVIMQMLEHNESHIEKYGKWARFAERNHMTDAGAFLDEAKYCATLENGALRKALDHIASI